MNELEPSDQERQGRLPQDSGAKTDFREADVAERLDFTIDESSLWPYRKNERTR